MQLGVAWGIPPSPSVSKHFQQWSFEDSRRQQVRRLLEGNAIGWFVIVSYGLASPKTVLIEFSQISSLMHVILLFMALISLIRKDYTD